VVVLFLERHRFLYVKKEVTVLDKVFLFTLKVMEIRMIIQTSTVHMSAEHEKTESIEITKTMDIDAFKTGFFKQFEEAQSLVKDSNEGQSNSILVMTEQGMQFRTSNDKHDLEQQREMIRAQLFESLMKVINPKYRDSGLPNTIDLPATASTVSDSQNTNTQVPLQRSPVNLLMSFKVSETIEEYECSSFSSCGKVTTADGKEIEFDLSLQMERSYSATREFEMTKSVEFTDPLIVNFDGNSADLSDEKFEFDLDADGDMELISYLSSGGMLAIDNNEDGTINDGTELFGALSGNGFADLAQFDEDGNNYIDEADSIYDDLLLWTKTEEVDSLVSVAEQGIGAIYLGSTQTPFDIKGADNQQNGRVTASGFYLNETGEVGTIQQVDMAV
jgi:hypothetical protein